MFRGREYGEYNYLKLSNSLIANVLKIIPDTLHYTEVACLVVFMHLSVL